MDRLCVSTLIGFLLAHTAVAQQPAGRSLKERRVAQLLEQFDKDSNGVLEASEIAAPLTSHFAGLDADNDGKFSAAELLKMRGRPGLRIGEIITGAARQERYDDTLEVGDPAPDFTLADPHGKTQLASNWLIEGERLAALQTQKGSIGTHTVENGSRSGSIYPMLT